MTAQATDEAATETTGGGTPIVEEVADSDVEVVDERPAAPPAVRPESTALDRAAQEMLATPGAPGRDEFLVLATTARLLSMSRGAPAQVRDDPWLAFHMALIGRDFGISPSAAIAQIDVIGEGADAQLAPSPELMNGQIKRLGLGSIVPAHNTERECYAVAMEPGGRLDPRCSRIWPEHVEADSIGGPCRCTHDRILGEYHFTWEEAQAAGLVKDGCEPFAHSTDCLRGGQGSKGKRCRQGYRTYPKRMMWWRAAGYCADDYFPEASVGLYTPEELGAVVDPDTGRMVDPGSVDLPEGFDPPERPHNPADDVVADATDETDPDLAADARDLTARIEAVKQVGGDPLAALRDLWEQEDEEGRRKTPPWLHPGFRRRHLTRARAVVKSVEDKIKRGEWGEDAKVAWADASAAGAGFGIGQGTGEPAPGSPSPHHLARERAAREAAATGSDAEDGPRTPETAADGDGDDTPESAETATSGDEAPESGDENGTSDPPDGDDPAREACIGCGKPIKSTADGRNHPGPNGRAGEPHRSWHRSCAPFD